MRVLFFLMVFLFVIIGCSAPETKEEPLVNVDSIPYMHVPSDQVKALVDSANRIGNDPSIPDYEMRAMEFAMQAKNLDSNYFGVQFNIACLQRNMGMITSDVCNEQITSYRLSHRLYMIGIGKSYEDKGDTTTARRYYESVLTRTRASADTLEKFSIAQVEAKILHTIALICLNENADAKTYSEEALQNCDDKEQRDFLVRLQTTSKRQLYSAYSNKKW